MIPVTHRGVANQVVMCTGYGRDGTSPDLIQYHPEQTIVFLMAVGRLHDLCHKLQTYANYPSHIPVAIVENAGCPNQRTVVGDMTTIASLAEKYHVKPPSTIIVGNVVQVLLDDDFECSEQQQPQLDDVSHQTNHLTHFIHQHTTNITNE
jgi:siroheme synthase